MVMINIEDLIDRACRKFRLENIDVPLGLTKFSDYLRSLYPEHYLKIEDAAQAKDSTATGPQQTQAIIYSNNECAYCYKTNYGCSGNRVKCMGFSGRKLTAC